MARNLTFKNFTTYADAGKLHSFSVSGKAIMAAHRATGQTVIARVPDSTNPAEVCERLNTQSTAHPKSTHKEKPMGTKKNTKAADPLADLETPVAPKAAKPAKKAKDPLADLDDAKPAKKAKGAPVPKVSKLVGAKLQPTAKAADLREGSLRAQVVAAFKGGKKFETGVANLTGNLEQPRGQAAKGSPEAYAKGRVASAVRKGFLEIV